VIGLLRERGLALVALTLAVIGLASGSGGAHTRRTGVLVAASPLAAGTIVRSSALRVVQIDAADRTPGMATRRVEVVGRATRVRLSAGDYVLRASVTASGNAITLQLGERAVPLSVEAAAAPPLSLLRAGARVDVVAEHDADRDTPAHGELIARGLTLLEAGRATDDGLAVTVRAPLAVALRLATAQAQAHRLRLFALPASGSARGGNG
jgi:Flp pilus assembly protein CpaB